jgi:antitoxin MazE6
MPHGPLLNRGYTKGMKTAVSIPDDVFAGAERLARRTKKSRSQLFSEAMREYLARHAPDEVTDSIDRVCAELGSPRDEFVSLAARRVLERSEW